MGCFVIHTDKLTFRNYLQQSLRDDILVPCPQNGLKLIKNNIFIYNYTHNIFQASINNVGKMLSVFCYPQHINRYFRFLKTCFVLFLLSSHESHLFMYQRNGFKRLHNGLVRMD